MDDDAIAARIDRLPISNLHRLWLLIVALPLFFDTCDIFTFSYAAPVLLRRWTLKIDDIALVTSAGFLGMAIGGALGGMISDRIGRRRGLMLFTAIFSSFSLANSFAANVETLVATRLLTGIGIAAATVTAITFLAEMFPAAVRGRWQSWAMVIGLSGIPVTSWVARLVVPMGDDGWRWIFVWGALGLPFLLLARRLPESPRWLARKGRTADAETVMDAIERRVAAEMGPLPAPAPTQRLTPQPARWGDLFSAHNRRRTLSLCAIWFCQTIGFYGFMSWAPTLLEREGFEIVHSLTYVTLITMGAIPGTLLAVFVSERFERKFSIAAAALTIAVFGLLYGLTFQPLMIVIFGFLAATAMDMFSALCFSYTPEQFPTAIRNSGAGLAYGVGRLANVINPFVVAAIYTSAGYHLVFAYIAGAWLLTAAVALVFGARTNGRALEAIGTDDNPQSTWALQAGAAQ